MEEDSWLGRFRELAQSALSRAPAWARQVVLGELAGDTLTRALQHADPGVRLASLEAVAAQPREQYLDAVVAALHDAHEMVRACAAHALGQYQSIRVGRHLKSALLDPHPTVRVAAAQALGQIPTLRFSQELEQRLADEDSAVRAAAARALGRVGRAEALPFLRALAVRDPRQWNRQVAHQAAAELQRRSASEEEKRWQARAELAEILLDNGRSWDVRERAKACMIRLGGRPLVPILADALQATDDIDVHVHIVDVLVTLAPCRELQNVLIGLLHHVASRVRRRAMQALAEMGDEEAIYYLNEIARQVEKEPSGLLDLFDAQGALQAVQEIGQRTRRGYSLEAK